jgi:trimeric autotransporter adhesin
VFRLGGLALLFTLLTVAPALAAPQADLVKDIRPGPGGSEPRDYARLGERLYFSAYEGSNGSELWATNGATGGTALVKDIETGTDSSSPAGMTPFGGRLFFSASDLGHSGELWSTDGTGLGTGLVEDIYAGSADGSFPSEFFAFGSALFFVAETAAGRELWKTAGPGADPVAIIDPDLGDPLPPDFAQLGGKLIFRATDASFGSEPWFSNGEPTGTGMVADIAPFAANSNPAGFTELGGKLYFSANNGIGGTELWATSGGLDDATLVKDINLNPSGGSDPSGFAKLGDKLYFAAFDPTNGVELWKTDGTEDGTDLVGNIAPGNESSYPFGLTVHDGKLFFQAHNSDDGAELWVSDGTTDGTRLVKDINPGNASANPGGTNLDTDGFTPLGGKLYFQAQTAADGSELWVTDGTAAGTQQVRDIYQGSEGSYPDQLTELNGKLYFSADDGVNGEEPWVVSDPQPVVAPPVGGPRTAPRIGRLRMTNKRFATRKPKQGKPRHKVGTKFQFSLSAAGKVTILIERKSRGYRSGKRCVAKRPKGKPIAKRCDRFKRARTVRANGKQGANSVAFKGKRLKPGGYRATVTVTAGGLKSKPMRVGFKIVAP